MTHDRAGYVGMQIERDHDRKARSEAISQPPQDLAIGVAKLSADGRAVQCNQQPIHLRRVDRLHQRARNTLEGFTLDRATGNRERREPRYGVQVVFHASGDHAAEFVVRSRPALQQRFAFCHRRAGEILPRGDRR
jgi:hypothetical protein